MSSANWPPAEVEAVAKRSGKPLEVTTAMAFIKRGWSAELGSYFADGALDVLRELDVLVTKQGTLPGSGSPIHVRVLVSCKGTRPDTAPLTYTLSRNDVPSLGRQLPSLHRLGRDCRPLSEVEDNAAKMLLKACGLIDAPPIVAFDLVRRKEEGRDAKLRVTYDGVGDRDLYEGLDSAIKASFAWTKLDRNSSRDFASLYVPLLVLAEDYWSVPIDGGVVGTPVRRSSGYHAARYPLGGRMAGTMSLVCSATALEAVVSGLDALFEWFTTFCARMEANRS